MDDNKKQWMEPLTLTEGDRIVLDSYCSLCDSLSHFLGSAYELVLHSLASYEHSAIKVINGYHTGRTEGAPITDLALKMLKKIQTDDAAREYQLYFSTNRNGSPLKSATMPVYGENGRIIGLLCINFYLDTPLSDILGSFIPQGMTAPQNTMTETHMNSAEDMIQEAVQRISKEVYDNRDIPAANRNKEIIARLNADGIFNIKNAVVICAELLGISKNTVYLHLRNLS